MPRWTLHEAGADDVAAAVAVAVAVAVAFEVAVAVQVPVERAVSAVPGADKVRRLSERKRSGASLAAPRSGYRRHGHPAQRGAITGVAFFWLLFLAKQKK